MIKEDYVSFETAKLLKEKRFNEFTLYYYVEGHLLKHYSALTNSDTAGISAPTLQMAMKWLREVHNINIEIHYNRFGENYKYLIIYKPEVFDDIRSLGVYFHYEEAVEAAIKYCLENLL